MLRDAKQESSIGGAPQLVRIAEHMNTKVIGVKWGNANNKFTTVMGRQIFEYENTDNLTIDPDTFKYTRPRSFGYREPQLEEQDKV